MRPLAWLGALIWGWAALVALLDRWARLDIRNVEPAPAGRLVSVIVPAREEERGRRCTSGSEGTRRFGTG